MRAMGEFVERVIIFLVGQQQSRADTLTASHISSPFIVSTRRPKP